MAVQTVFPAGSLCHCTVGVGPPDAAALKVTLAPTAPAWLVGWSVMCGGAPRSPKSATRLAEVIDLQAFREAGRGGIELPTLSAVSGSVKGRRLGVMFTAWPGGPVCDGAVVRPDWRARRRRGGEGDGR